ncbi:MAG TPA: hypothetical protein VKD72_01380, partial [Gemmataceae bacterium]|nr:hypothetical protein [Gemmataceae bacterium]
MMTERDFDAQVQEIQARYVGAREGADAGRDQDLAWLFVEAKESGRTLEWIGERMNWSKGQVSRRLLFGRFLKVSGPETLRKLPKSLTEWRFRGNWRKARKRAKETEDERFARVLDLLREDTSDALGKYANLVKKPGIKAVVVEVLREGKRLTSPEIADRVSATIPDTDAKQVTQALKDIQRKPPKGTAFDHRSSGRTHKYRLVERKGPAVAAIAVDPDAAGVVAAESLPL